MDFYRRIAVVCACIPCGHVATYGQIALLCGKPKNSRQVGFGLNRKLEGEFVPAHRVVNHQGFLSGAGAFDYPDLQRRLLEEEGVMVDAEQQVDLKQYRWKNTMDEAEELLREFDRLGI